jgi:hypothetical protein
MKKLLSAIFVISSFFASAQFPQGINYQSIIRNTSGVILPSTPVTVEFKLYSSPTSSLSTILLYDETHSATTNSFGMVNLVIGHGTPIGGVVAFNNIPWIVGIEYEVWVNSSQMGTRQPFMSVPYAFNALTADWAPSPTLSVTGNTLTVGSNTVTIPTGPSYTAGTGIGISGNTITNNAPDQTVTVTGLGSATVTGTYPNFTIETPTVAAATPPTITGAGSATVTSSGNTFTVNTPVPQVYTAGNGIDISGGVISNTATAATPSISGTGITTVTSSGNTFTVNTPAYTAGNGIDITGGVITNTAAAVTPTITGTGSANVTSAGNSFTVDVAPAVTPTVTGTGIAVVTPTTGNTFNVDVPAPVLSYNQGTKELSITQGSAVTTQTLIGTGSNTISLVGSDLATVTPTTGSNFTVSVPTPSMTVVGGNLTGTYPTQTLTIPSSSTTLVQGTNVTLNQSGNTYTVNSVTPTLNVIGGSLTGSYPTQTLTIPTASTYVGTAGNISVSSNTINLATTGVTAGTYGNNATSTVPTFSVDNFGRLTTASQYVPNVAGDVIGAINATTVQRIQGRQVAVTAPSNGQVLTWNGTSSVWTPSTVATVLTGTGTGVATVTTSATNFTVNVPAPTYNASTGVLTTGTQSVTVAPTLALSGTTLTSGASTNSVNLATLPGLWSASSTTAVILTTASNNVGIGTTPAPQYKLDVAATGAASVTIHGFNTGATDAFAGVYGENSSTGIGVYAQSNGGKGVFGKSTSGSGVYGESTNGDAGKFLMTGAGASSAVNAQTNGTGAALYAKSFNAVPLAGRFDGHVNIGGKARIDSTLTMASYSVMPAVSVANEGRIYFDRPMGKFMVSENAGAYKPLFGAAPWVQSPGQVTLNTITDMVGIGTGAPNAQLEVVVSNSVSDGVQINIQDVNNGGNALQVSHSGIGNAAFLDISNTSNSSSALTASTNGSGHVINATQNGTGQAGRFFINNTSNNSSAVWARTTGGGPVFTAEQFGTGRAVDFRIFGSSNNQAVIFAQTVGTGPGGYFEVTNTSSGNNAIVGATFGTGDAILGNHLGNSGSAGHFNIPGGSPNTSPALLATNIASGNALNAAAGDGYAVYATSSSSVNSTIYANNSGIADAAQIIAGQGRAMYLANNSTSGYAALEVSNGGTGNVITAYKSGGAGGNIGSFSNNSASNAADAVLISNNGAGAALHSISASTSTVGLWVQNGHMKSTQAAQPGVATFSATGGASAATYTLTNGTDVKGSLLAVVTTTGMINAGGQVTMRVTFSKAYSVSPTVVITPTSDFGLMSYYISAVAPGSFNVTLKNNTATNISGSSQSYSFNYFVIE